MSTDHATEKAVHPAAVRQLGAILAWAAFGLAIAVNLWGIYAPSQPGSPPFPGFDKVAHLGSFALIMLTGLAAGIRARPLVTVLVLHAVTSELVQATVLPERSGDPLDVAADLIGIGVGWLAWRAWSAIARKDSR